MASKEKFGKFVLLEEIDRSGWGTEYRAAKLGSTGLEKIVTITRLTPSISSNPRAVKQLMEQIKFAAQLHSPNVTKVLGIGKVGASYYVSAEFVEGKSLKATFARSRQEGLLLLPDHALLIANRVCLALEHAHGRKTADGRRYFHGFLNPGNVSVSYEGDVRVSGFGLWPGGVQSAGVITEEEARYLAPEQVVGGPGDTRSDAFAVGTLLFEALTGKPLFEGARHGDVAGRLFQARLQSPVGEDDSLPEPIREILNRSLTTESERRYPEIQEMRKSLDTLIFSGDLTSTTFDLAFLMHSLFREEIDRESQLLREEKAASYIEYLMGPEKTPEPKAPPPLMPQTETGPIRAMQTEAVPHEPVAPPPPLAPRTEVVPHGPAEPPPPETVAEPVAVASPDTGPGLTFARQESRSKMLRLAGVAAVIALIALGSFLLLRGRYDTAVSPPPTTLSAGAAAALARVKELEAELAALEAAKEAAQAAAAEEAKQELEAQAKVSGQELDPEAVARAQEIARRRAEAEQARRLEAERQRLEEEKRAEEAWLEEERRKTEETRLAEEARLAAAVTTTSTTTAPAPPPTTLPPVRMGMLVDISDSDVIPPVVEKSPSLSYPRIALRQQVEGVVKLNALIDENGKVVDVKVVKAAGGKTGLTEAAVTNLQKRKYHPATKRGVPVKVWLPVSVRFELEN